MYAAIHAWLHKIPGGLGVANVIACALFAAMAGSSLPVRRSARLAYPKCGGVVIRPASPPASSPQAARYSILLPPSITMILYAVASEQSLGRLFLAGVGPGLLLILMFIATVVIPDDEKGDRLAGSSGVKVPVRLGKFLVRSEQGGEQLDRP